MRWCGRKGFVVHRICLDRWWRFGGDWQYRTAPQLTFAFRRLTFESGDVGTVDGDCAFGVIGGHRAIRNHVMGQHVMGQHVLELCL